MTAERATSLDRGLDEAAADAADAAAASVPLGPGGRSARAVDVDPEYVRMGLRDLMQQVARVERQRVSEEGQGEMGWWEVCQMVTMMCGLG